MCEEYTCGDQMATLVSQFSHCVWSQGSGRGCQTCHQELLPAKQFYQPRISWCYLTYFTKLNTHRRIYYCCFDKWLLMLNLIWLLWCFIIIILDMTVAFGVLIELNVRFNYRKLTTSLIGSSQWLMFSFIIVGIDFLFLNNFLL